jgi:uncharacterized membrane protein (UPF0127 family)
VTALPEDEGMLFLYRRAGTRTMWMQGCAIDLDIAFLDEHGRILQLSTLRARRSTGKEPQRASSAQPAAMVLEMAAGWFARHGAGIGTTVVLPADVDRGNADP